MRFRRFLETLIESGNTKASNIWIETMANKVVRLNFIMKNDKDSSNELFAAEIRALGRKEIGQDVEGLERLLKFRIASVSWGNVLEDGSINYLQVKRSKPTAGLKIMSAAKNVITDYIKHHNIDIIIFSAKNIDGGYAQRAGAYDLISSVSAKQNGMTTLRYEDKDGTYYILLKPSVNLSKEERKLIEQILIPKITFFDKEKK